MTIKVAKYSTESFNHQLDFGEALTLFDSLHGDSLADTTMRDLFRHYGVETIFGLQLLHKHNQLTAEEKLTDIRGTSSPLNFDMGARPSVWGFQPSAPTLVPLEYSLDARSVNFDVPHVQRFLHAFHDSLGKAGLVDVLGLSLYPGDGYPGRVEFTVGRSNISLRPDEVCISDHCPLVAKLDL